MSKLEIHDEVSYQKTLKSLNKQDKPPRILCFLMNILESYRQARKMGWSRAWNKYGLTTFQSFQLNSENDVDFIQQAEKAILALPNIPPDANRFMQEIFNYQEHFMGFLFFSEYKEDKQYYESVTMSFGAKVKDNPRVRERFDVIIDCPINDAKALAPSRIRLYIDPYRNGEKEPLYQANLEASNHPELLVIFQQLCDYSWQHHANPEKLWHHWTSNYINYFGERQIPLSASHFHLEAGERINEADTCTLQ